MKNLKVSLGSRSYPIVIGRRLSHPVIRKAVIGMAEPAVVLTNRRLYKLHGKSLKTAFRSHRLRWIFIAEGEHAKNLKTVAATYHRLIRLGAQRRTPLVAFGGGVIGDIGGFVAATYLRGIPYFQVPTTLLAMVDSSVGGKTGVDLRAGKNLVGAFYQPSAVFIATDFLQSLPPKELRCGLAEIVKYGILRDAAFFSFLEKNSGRIMKRNSQAVERAIYRSAQIKAEIVSRDEREAGLRSLLNLGHTLGHAIETVMGYTGIRHGEAVSQGIAHVARLSRRRGWLSPRDCKRILEMLSAFGLPTDYPPLPRRRILAAIRKDKKSRGTLINAIGIDRIGKARIVPMTPAAFLKGYAHG